MNMLLICIMMLIKPFEYYTIDLFLNHKLFKSLLD